MSEKFNELFGSIAGNSNNANYQKLYNFLNISSYEQKKAVRQTLQKGKATTAILKACIDSKFYSENKNAEIFKQYKKEIETLLKPNTPTPPTK